VEFLLLLIRRLLRENNNIFLLNDINTHIFKIN